MKIKRTDNDKWIVLLIIIVLKPLDFKIIV